MPRLKGLEPETALPADGLEHPHRRQLERFLRGDSPREEACTVVRHLLTGCPECAKVTRRTWRFADQKPFLRSIQPRYPQAAAGAFRRRA